MVRWGFESLRMHMAQDHVCNKDKVKEIKVDVIKGNVVRTEIRCCSICGQ